MKSLLAAVTPVCLVISGCAGSPAWHKTASTESINAFYDSMPVYELCMRWDRVFEKDLNVYEVRAAISRALVRRGEPAEKCYNRDRDMAITKAKLQKERAEREAQSAGRGVASDLGNALKAYGDARYGGPPPQMKGQSDPSSINQPKRCGLDQYGREICGTCYQDQYGQIICK